MGKKAAEVALKSKCSICMAQMPDPKTYKQHFENKHPKAALPAELSHITLLKSLTTGWGRPSSCRSSPWVGSQGPSTGLVDLSASSPVPTLLCIFPRLVFEPLRQHTI